MPAAVRSLRTLRAVLRTALLAVLDALGIQHAAQHVITHAGKVAHTPAADQHDAVFLQVVALARDVRNDFAAVGQTDLGDLAQRRVRLLRGRGIDASANAALLRVLLHRRDLALGLLRHATLADQLVDRRHEVLFTLVGGHRGKVKHNRIAHAAMTEPCPAGLACTSRKHSTRLKRPGYFDGLPGKTRRTGNVQLNPETMSGSARH